MVLELGETEKVSRLGGLAGAAATAGRFDAERSR
jgi:hypothetical protein